MESKYLVVGRWNGRRINQTVNAYSPAQAKLRAGFNMGLGGSELRNFIKSTKIKAKRSR